MTPTMTTLMLTATPTPRMAAATPPMKGHGLGATIEWSATFDDPHTWTRPWTFVMNLTKKDQSQRPFEYACHEGNYGMVGILNAARAEERQGKDVVSPKEAEGER